MDVGMSRSASDRCALLGLLGSMLRTSAGNLDKSHAAVSAENQKKSINWRTREVETGREGEWVKRGESG